MRLCLQRSSIREEWGVTLHQVTQGDRLRLSVKAVATDSPAYKLLQVGDHIITINDWEIEKIKEPEVAENLFRAAGNSVNLDVEK